MTFYTTEVVKEFIRVVDFQCKPCGNNEGNVTSTKLQPISMLSQVLTYRDGIDLMAEKYRDFIMLPGKIYFMIKEYKTKLNH